MMTMMMGFISPKNYHNHHHNK